MVCLLFGVLSVQQEKDSFVERRERSGGESGAGALLVCQQQMTVYAVCLCLSRFLILAGNCAGLLGSFQKVTHLMLNTTITTTLQMTAGSNNYHEVYTAFSSFPTHPGNPGKQLTNLSLMENNRKG